MMNHGGGPTLPPGQIKRLQHQFGAQMSFHRPADDSTAESIEYHRQVKKSGPGRDVSDVGDPQSIGRRGDEVSFNQVRRRSRVPLPRGGGYPGAPADAAKARVSHQPCYPLAADVNSFGGQFRMNPRSSIGGARALMNGRDPRAQYGIRSGARRRWPREPRVVAAGGDAQYAAHGNNGVHGLVGPYEPERRDGVEPVS